MTTLNLFIVTVTQISKSIHVKNYPGISSLTQTRAVSAAKVHLRADQIIHV